MIRIFAIFAAILSAAQAAKIDLPRSLPTPFGIELGKPFEASDTSMLASNNPPFDIYEITPPNPIEEIDQYKLYVSQRYGISSLIIAMTKKKKYAQTAAAFAAIKEKLTGAYGEPRLPTKKEFEIYDYELGFSPLDSYGMKYFWKQDGWSIMMIRYSTSSAGLVIFNIDKLTRRSIDYAPDVN